MLVLGLLYPQVLTLSAGVSLAVSVWEGNRSDGVPIAHLNSGGVRGLATLGVFFN